MTHNQIELWKLIETRRSNEANESIKRVQNVETERSNRASENINYQKNLETQRSNRAQEELKRLDQMLSMNVAEINAAATRYRADQTYAASAYSADQNARMRAREIAIDQQNTSLKRIETQAKVENTKAQTALAQLDRFLRPAQLVANISANAMGQAVSLAKLLA